MIDLCYRAVFLHLRAEVEGRQLVVKSLGEAGEEPPAGGGRLQLEAVLDDSAMQGVVGC